MDQPEGDARCEAEREAADVDVGHAAVAVAEVGADLGHPVAGDDDPQPVAHREHEGAVGHEVDVTAAHPADGGSELLVEVQLGDGVADELLVRQGDAAEVELVAVLDDVVRRDVPEVLGDLVEHEAGPDDGDEVVVADQLGPGRHDRRVRRVCVLQAGDADLLVMGRGQARHAHRLVHLDPHRDVADLLATGVRARAAQRPGRDGQHHDDAPEVGDRVADGGGRGVGRAGGGRRERRGVGQRTGVRAGDGAGREAQQAAEQHGEGADQGEGSGDHEHGGPATTQRGEEVRARHHADRVGEQHQAEGADDLGDLELDVERRRPRPRRQRREQHGGRAEAHAGDAHVADGGAQRQQDREEEEGGVGEQLEQCGHDLHPSTVSRRPA